ncbi:MAG: GNAT family N-acetyltransferase [Acidobacteriaceae bacterium]
MDALQLRFERLGNERTFLVPELQISATKNPLDNNRAQYRVWLGDEEAAFITFDIFWPDELNLYEIVVAKHLRRRGVGASVIQFAADLARTMEKKRLSIRAGRIGEQTKDELISYYQRRGLVLSADQPDLLYLEVTP